MNKKINTIKERVLFRLKSFDQIPQRLFDELDYINENGGADALLLMSDLVRHLRSEGIYVGPGHASETCSLLCYGLGITDVNPLVWNLPFEPFACSLSSYPSLTLYTSTGGLEKATTFLKSKNHITVSTDTDMQYNLVLNFLEDDKFLSMDLFIYTPISMDKMREMQKCCSKRLSLLELDEETLVYINEAKPRLITGFEKEEEMKHIQEMMPECFSDLYLLHTLEKPLYKDLLQRVLNNKINHDVTSTGFAEVDRILMESYGVLVYREQQIQIEKIRHRLPAGPEADALKELATSKPLNLILKGGEIARMMFAIENAWFIRRFPEKFLKIEKQVRMERIHAARERIINRNRQNIESK